MSAIKLLVAGALTLALAGCATPYVLTLKDGSQIHTQNKPVYNDTTGFYEYQSTSGAQHEINKDEVRSMTPAPKP